MALTNGKLKSVFSLKVGTQDWVSDIVSFELTSDEAEQEAMTFAEYNAGTNRTWVLSVSAAWDGGSADSLHSYLWDNAGTTATFEVQPSQGVVSATKPKYTGSVRIPFRPDISVEAGNESTFDYEFEVVGEPNKVISAT